MSPEMWRKRQELKNPDVKKKEKVELPHPLKESWRLPSKKKVK
jgi:hypothetical protein